MVVLRRGHYTGEKRALTSADATPRATLCHLEYWRGMAGNESVKLRAGVQNLLDKDQAATITATRKMAAATLWCGL